MLLVVVAGSVAADAVVRRREIDRLLVRVGTSQDAIGYSNRRVLATVAYTTPLLFSPRVPPRVRDGLQQLVEDEARGQLPSLRAERAAARRTSVLPWHGDLTRARAALVRYLDERLRYLQDIAGGIRALYVERPELQRLLDRARRAFLAAAGSWRRGRVTAAFAGGISPG